MEYQATGTLQDAGILCQPLHGCPRPKSPQVGELQGLHIGLTPWRGGWIPSSFYPCHQGLYMWAGIDLD